jgi:hypothetical protein
MLPKSVAESDGMKPITKNNTKEKMVMFSNLLLSFPSDKSAIS